MSEHIRFWILAILGCLFAIPAFVVFYWTSFWLVNETIILLRRLLPFTHNPPFV